MGCRRRGEPWQNPQPNRPDGVTIDSLCLQYSRTSRLALPQEESRNCGSAGHQAEMSSGDPPPLFV